MTSVFCCPDWERDLSCSLPDGREDRTPRLGLGQKAQQCKAVREREQHEFRADLCEFRGKSEPDQCILRLSEKRGLIVIGLVLLQRVFLF